MNNFRTDDQFIYLNDPYMEFYIPLDYFDETKKFAEDFSDYVNVLGIFTVGIFKDGKISEYKTMKHPYMIKVYVYESETRTVSIPHVGDVRCKVICFNKDQKVMDAQLIRDAINALTYLNLITNGKVPHSVPYDKAAVLWQKNQEMNDVNFGVRPEVEETVLSLVYRKKGVLSEKFAKTFGSEQHTDPFNYDTADLRKVCQYASTFSSVTFEDIDTMITTSINRARNKIPEMYTPVEQTIKM